jgi:hypothetical protein
MGSFTTTSLTVAAEALVVAGHRIPRHDHVGLEVLLVRDRVGGIGGRPALEVRRAVA